mmetsp:Transcript_20129/g.52600  ORF Transcript_20129/g.52600 Transcript_20129/m.52600 type:complete len:207 (-) Transcript_20129:663-1283(-)
MSFTMRSLIIFLTLTKGSAVTRSASAVSTRLFSSRPLDIRYCATLPCASVFTVSARSMAKTVPCWANDGRCLSALPATAPLEMISMALLMASISSERSCCLDSKSEAFCSQVAVRSDKYFTSASIVVVVSWRLPVASALAWSFLALVADFASRSDVAWSTCAVRSCMSMSYACLPFISSFSRVVRSFMNSSSNFSNISTMPCDWNS